ncbi:MAG TPA: hypothetical protein VJ184_13770, partial [Chryseolinea sp.]|nr:hypothetical protein [Chryseolinea sp.]
MVAKKTEKVLLPYNKALTLEMSGFDLVSESNRSLPCAQKYIDMKFIKTSLRFIDTLAISAASAHAPEFINLYSCLKRFP